LYETNLGAIIVKFYGAAVRPEIIWLLKWQSLLVLCAAGAAGLFGSADAAISALIGGGIGILGAFAYAWRALRGGETDPAKLYRAQLLGETYKIAVVLGGFALVFVEYKDLAALPLFLGFALTVAVYWAALLKTRN
jgi:ATP synthase protein I